MFDDREFITLLAIDRRRLEGWIARDWLVPYVENGERRYREVDLARARLLIDLDAELGVNPEGIDLIIDLVDQLHTIRSVVREVGDTLSRQPDPVRRAIAEEIARRHGH